MVVKTSKLFHNKEIFINKYNFPPILEQNFRDTCEYFCLDEELTRYILAIIDYDVYDSFIVPKYRSGNKRIREFVAIAFNDLNVYLEWEYEQLYFDYIVLY